MQEKNTKTEKVEVGSKKFTAVFVHAKESGLGGTGKEEIFFEVFDILLSK